MRMAIAPAWWALAASMCLGGCGEDPRTNRISREATPLAPAVADPGAGFTFAQRRDPAGHVATLLVLRLDGETIRAVDLTAAGAPPDADVFDVVARMGDRGLRQAATRAGAGRAFAIAELLPAAGTGQRHVATGANFREHAREAEIDAVFTFPKFGPATPARTTVQLKPGALLDYEVEICARFDRDIRSLRDFDRARKGFFLCGDFTDRAQLMRLVDPGNVASGRGFSDAKSGADFFPSGPFLVVPRDWRAFVRAERMTTEVNRQVRQDARGAEMILDFRAVVARALTGGSGAYTFRGTAVPLLAAGGIVRGGAVMSGTSEGVIFMPPRARDYLTGGTRYVFTGPMLRGGSAMRVMIDGFIDKERRSGRYLKAGDVVTHGSASMGTVTVRVIRAPRSRAAGGPAAS